jgi:gluconokinase
MSPVAGEGKSAATTPPYVLALDIGTSSVRALLFDATGAAVLAAQAQRAYPLQTTTDGAVAVDADLLVAVTAEVVDEALALAGPLAHEIGAVATDTFWHSLVAVDAGGRPLTTVITWADTRPRDAAHALRAELDERAIHQRTGAMLHASYWPAKLRWLRETAPQVFAGAHEYLSFGEYLHRQLLGRSVCSLSMASGTGLLEAHARAWDHELLAALGIEPEQLPPLGDLREALRGLVPAYATRWPALRDVPWFPAIGDGATANVGSGAVSASHLALTIGTSSALRAIVPLDATFPPPGLWLYLLDAQRAVLGGALSEGGNLLAWLERTLRLPALVEAEPVVAALPPDGHGLTLLPFLAGERSPGWHDAARATIAGICTETTPAEILRAGLEALAYRIGTVFTRLTGALASGGMAATPTVIGSGGAFERSAAFRQILADVLGVPLYPSREHEASARGAALLALEALGLIRDVAALPPPLDTPVQPDASRRPLYQRAAARQQQLYQLLLDSVD